MLWTSAEFGFATIDDAYSSGSSIMPQKKNPDAYELMRGSRTASSGTSTPYSSPSKASPLGYSKDLQEDKEPLFDAVDSVLAMLAVLPEMRTARFDEVRMVEAQGFRPRHGAGGLPLGEGVPFREAHRAVGRLVRRCEELGVSLEDASRGARGGASRALGGARRAAYAARERADKRSAGSTAPVPSMCS